MLLRASSHEEKKGGLQTTKSAARDDSVSAHSLPSATTAASARRASESRLCAAALPNAQGSAETAHSCAPAVSSSCGWPLCVEEIAEDDDSIEDSPVAAPSRRRRQPPDRDIQLAAARRRLASLSTRRVGRTPPLSSLSSESPVSGDSPALAATSPVNKTAMRAPSVLLATLPAANAAL
jgi:hypothetical protein